MGIQLAAQHGLHGALRASDVPLEAECLGKDRKRGIDEDPRPDRLGVQRARNQLVCPQRRKAVEEPPGIAEVRVALRLEFS